MEFRKVYMPAVLAELRRVRPARVLDLPSGNGWLASAHGGEPDYDGIDLFEDKPDGYAGFWKADLDEPLPVESGRYDAVVTCEGIEHIGNPLLFLRECHRALKPGGTLIVSTPNVWAPASRLQFLLRGFFLGFPSLAGRIRRGTHMHISPFSFPHLYLYMTLAGFSGVRLLDTPVKKPRHFWERWLGWPQRRYCRSKMKRAGSDEERAYWRAAGSEESVYGRAMVVAARAAKADTSI